MGAVGELQRNESSKFRVPSLPTMSERIGNLTPERLNVSSHVTPDNVPKPIHSRGKR